VAAAGVEEGGGCDCGGHGGCGVGAYGVVGGVFWGVVVLGFEGGFEGVLAIVLLGVGCEGIHLRGVHG